MPEKSEGSALAYGSVLAGSVCILIPANIPGIPPDGAVVAGVVCTTVEGAFYSVVSADCSGFDSVICIPPKRSTGS
jgi:hypothetical protein